MVTLKNKKKGGLIEVKEENEHDPVGGHKRTHQLSDDFQNHDHDHNH